MSKIAILASGRGSNFDAIWSAIQQRKLEADVVAVVSDQPGALVLEKAKRQGLKTILLEPSPHLRGEARRLAHDQSLIEALSPMSPRFLVMAGYMRVVTQTLIQAFDSQRGYSRITNIHPSLLPSFPGIDAYRQAFDHGVKVTGVSVHLVEEQVDSGAICAQEAFSIADCLNAEEVEKRGLAVEHHLYPQTLSWILKENFVIEKRQKGRVCVRPN